MTLERCIMCGKISEYISPDTGELLCAYCAKVDWEIRKSKGKYDLELKGGKI